MANPLLSQVNLENVDYDIADADARTRLSTLENAKGTAGGLCALDSNGKVSANVIPDTLGGNKTFTGNTNFKGNVTLASNKDLAVGGKATVSGTMKAGGVESTSGITGSTVTATTRLQSDTETVLNGSTVVQNMNASGTVNLNGNTTVKNIEIDQWSFKDGTNFGTGKHVHYYESKQISDATQLKADIAAQRFDKYNPGNYFHLTGVTIGEETKNLDLIFGDFNLFYGGYASGYATVNTPHIACIVKGLGNRRMNATNSTVGAYKNSEMHTWLSGDVLTGLEAALQPFGLEILQHKKLLSTEIDPNGENRFGTAENLGCSDKFEWNDEKIALMSEMQIYGATVWSSSGDDTGEAVRQLEIFRDQNFNKIFGGTSVWLRDVASAAHFAIASGNGYAYCSGASYANGGAFPLILLK